MSRGLLRAMLSNVGGSFIELKCARFPLKLAFLPASAVGDGGVVVECGDCCC